jgi:membrane protease YdiL (CAAX protease family)
MLVALTAGLAFVYALPGAAAAGEPSNPQLQLVARYMLGARAMGAVGATDAVDLLEALDVQAHSTTDRFRVIAVRAELQGTEAAHRRIDVMLGEEGLDREIEQDLLLLRRIYDREEPEPEARTRLLERHGWFARLALTHGQADDPERRSLEAGALRTVIGLAGLMLLGLGATVTGVVLLSLALIRRREILTSYVAPRPATRDTVWLETVVILLAAVLVSVLLSGHAGLSVALYVLLMLVPFWPRLRGVSPQEWREGLGLHRGRGAWREIGAGLLGYLTGFPIFVVGIALTLLLAALSDGSAAHPAVDQASEGPVGILGLLLAATIWAPWVEETVFRGALYRYLRSRTTTFWSAAVVGFFFAVVHPQGYVTIPALMSLGAVLAYIRHWRGSIIASMAAHAVHNLVLVGVLTFTLS